MKKVFFLILGFAIGYAVHAYMTANAIDVATVTAPLTGINTAPSDASLFVVAVSYENGDFKPKSVSVKQGNYLTITNNSDSLMWLTSDNPALTTPRGFGRSEQLRIRTTQTGDYKVGNKLNVNASGVIKIVP
jgi:hypothetical protein